MRLLPIEKPRSMKHVFFNCIKLITLGVLTGYVTPCSDQFIGQWKCDLNVNDRSLLYDGEIGSPYQFMFNQYQIFQSIAASTQASSNLKYQKFSNKM